MKTPPNSLIPPPTNFERGPAERGPRWNVLQDDERTLLDTVKPEDFHILKTVVARLWKSAPFADQELALEVISGEWKGVVFNVHNFEVLPVDLGKGMTPVKFQVRIFKSIPGFEHNEAFDDYAREVFLAWLQYIQTHEFRTLQAAEPSSSSTH